ncbi:MAG TPA: hypothetical protein VMH27_16825 [Puia sp.]|nr:hypothetical protein [Puia sp.]
MRKFYLNLVVLLPFVLELAPLTSSGQYLYIRSVSIVYNSKAYWEYLPLGYNARDTITKYPLMVYIHGAGDYGNGTPTDMKLVLRSGPVREMSLGQFPDSFNVGGKSYRFIVITPQFVVQPTVSDIDSVIDFCVTTYKVDFSRIYLTGLSMGGGMTWEYAGTKAAFANRLAAILPICGYALPDSLRGRVIAASNLPVWTTHNNLDPVAPVQWSIMQVQWINDAPSPNPLAMLTILDSANHDAWTKTYNPSFTVNNMNVYQWMLSHSRASRPPVVGIGRAQNITLPLCTATVSGSASINPGSIISHTWTFVSGPAVAVISNPSYNVTTVSGMTAAGVYTFKFSATDNANLTSSATTQIIVGLPIVPLESDSTPATGFATALDNLPENNPLFSEPLSLYPNPTGGSLQLHVNNPLTGRMKVDFFTSAGGFVREFVVAKTTPEMDSPLALGGMAPGDYVVVATIGSWRQSRKLLKW